MTSHTLVEWKWKHRAEDKHQSLVENMWMSVYNSHELGFAHNIVGADCHRLLQFDRLFIFILVHSQSLARSLAHSLILLHSNPRAVFYFFHAIHLYEFHRRRLPGDHRFYLLFLSMHRTIQMLAHAIVCADEDGEKRIICNQMNEQTNKHKNHRKRNWEVYFIQMCTHRHKPT